MLIRRVQEDKQRLLAEVWVGFDEGGYGQRDDEYEA